MYVWQLCWHNSAFLMNSTSTGESPPVDFFWSRYFSYMMKKGIIGVFTVFMIFVWPAAFCECAQLTGTWEYHRSSYERPPQELVQQNIPKGGWQKYDYPDKPPLLGDETCIWLRTALPDVIPKGAALFLRRRIRISGSGQGTISFISMGNGRKESMPMAASGTW